MRFLPLLLLVSSACAGPSAGRGSVPPATPAAQHAAAPEPLAPQPGEHDPVATARAQAEANRILAELGRARGLKVPQSVDVALIGRSEIRAFARALMEELLTPQQRARIGAVEASLGFIPVDADPEQVILDMLEQGVLGLYDPKTTRLYIGDFVPRTQLESVVGHEIAHGLQDMHFDLERLQAPNLGRSDLSAAWTFLVEGDAQATFMAWRSGLDALDPAVMDALVEQGLAGASVFPYPILARQLTLPYTAGTATVAQLAQQEGWSAVDALFHHALPTSSEQMLHPDKLATREPAQAIGIDPKVLATALGGRVPVWTDQLGEATLLSAFAEHLSVRKARAAAGGWGGDQLVAWSPPDAPDRAVPLTTAVVSWDSEQDAMQGYAALTDYLAHAMPGAWVAERRQDVLVFATRVPENFDRKHLLQTLWSSVTRNPPNPPVAATTVTTVRGPAERDATTLASGSHGG